MWFFSFFLTTEMIDYVGCWDVDVFDVVWRGSSDEVKSAVVIYLYLLGISL